MTPRTPEEWWDLFHRNKSHIEMIISRFSPKFEQDLVAFHKACKNRDPNRLIRVMHEAWFNAPDKPFLHTVPGWGDMCDLCSEEWVFGEAGE